MECRFWSVKRGVRSGECRVWSVEWRVSSVKNVKRGGWSVESVKRGECEVWCVKCGAWSGECEV